MPATWKNACSRRRSWFRFFGSSRRAGSSSFRRITLPTGNILRESRPFFLRFANSQAPGPMHWQDAPGGRSSGLRAAMQFTAASASSGLTCPKAVLRNWPGRCRRQSLTRAHGSKTWIAWSPRAAPLQDPGPDAEGDPADHARGEENDANFGLREYRRPDRRPFLVVFWVVFHLGKPAVLPLWQILGLPFRPWRLMLLILRLPKDYHQLAGLTWLFRLKLSVWQDWVNGI